MAVSVSHRRLDPVAEIIQSIGRRLSRKLVRTSRAVELFKGFGAIGNRPLRRSMQPVSTVSAASSWPGATFKFLEEYPDFYTISRKAVAARCGQHGKQ
jgi:hypothetical protein